MSDQLIREVAAVFDTAEMLEEAVFDLQNHGFDRAAFSLLAREHARQRSVFRRLIYRQHAKRLEKRQAATILQARYARHVHAHDLTA